MLRCLILLFCCFYATASFAFGKKSQRIILKANNITGDQNNSVLKADGNVEVINPPFLIKADNAQYNKQTKTITANGNVFINNLEIGRVYSETAEVGEDFQVGSFANAKILFNDGSYIFSNQINRQDENKTNLKDNIFSICPNQEIVENETTAGKKPDFITIHSKFTKINRQDNSFTSKKSAFYLYKLPFLYLPYLKAPLPPQKRQSGLLAPSYSRNSNFGFGIKTPYYLNISPSADITISPTYYFSSQQIILNTQARQILTYGKYDADLQLANNKLDSFNDAVVTERKGSPIRWHFSSRGDFDFNKNIGADFNIKTVSDRNFLRDYNFNYLPYTNSHINIDYINKNSYFGIKTIRFQELENKQLQKSAPLILPSAEAIINTRPLFFKEQLSLASNFTAINRDNGLQYRRLTLAPSIKIPFNLSGNLFQLTSKISADFYSLNNNYNNSTIQTNYKQNQSNIKTEHVASWSLPLRKKLPKNTIIIEPMANFVVSSFNRSNNLLPNEDSNNSELTVSNFFASNRISGFDRNEAGKRINYGLKASSFGQRELGFVIGQSFLLSKKQQDIKIRGFSNSDKSNIVGQVLMRNNRYFNFSYSFQLQESNLRNDVNQLNTNFNYKKLFLNNDLIVIRKTINNPQKISQSNTNFGFSYNIWQFSFNTAQDLITKRIIQKGFAINRNGCCTNFGFSISENNQSSLVKKQQTFSINFSFKNL